VAEQKCEISPSESRESKLKEPKKHLGLLLDLLVSPWTCLADDADRCVWHKEQKVGEPDWLWQSVKNLIGKHPFWFDEFDPIRSQEQILHDKGKSKDQGGCRSWSQSARRHLSKSSRLGCVFQNAA
jgi:hypothetical protein